MSELLTESFCERCGTRYTFESGEPETRRPSIKKARVLARGLKHFVLSDDSLETALAEGERDEDRERAALQLEAFHQTFNFCMDCRQYTCRDCWNDAEGRCLSCAPAPGRIESVMAVPVHAETDTASRLDALLGPGPIAPPAIEAWPMEAAFAPPVGEAVEAPAELEGPDQLAAPAELEGPDQLAAPAELEAPDQLAAPAEAGIAAPEGEPSVVLEPPVAAEFAGAAEAATAAPAPPAGEPEVPAEALPEWLAVEPEAPIRGPSLEEYLLAASAAQGVHEGRSAAESAGEPVEALAAPEVDAAPTPPEPLVPERAVADGHELAGEAVPPVAESSEPALIAGSAQEPAPEPVTPAAPAPATETGPEPVPAATPTPIFTPPTGGDARRSTTRLPGWDMVAPDVAGLQPPPLPHLTAAADVRPAPWFAARTNASIWDASSADVVNRPGSGVQSCVSCGLPLSAAAHFCRRCGARQSA